MVERVFALPSLRERLEAFRRRAGKGLYLMTTMDLLATMKKGTLTGITAGVWVAASGVAAALAYELNRPLYEIGHSGAALPPLAGALLAAGWLAMIGAIFGWRRPLVRAIPA